MRVLGRFEVVDACRPAVRHLLDCCLVPSRRRERLALRAHEFVRRYLGGDLPPAFFGCKTSPRHADIPERDAALEALRSVAEEAGLPRWEGGLDLVAGPSAPTPTRLLFLWREGEWAPAAVAKVAPEHAKGRLIAEGRALRELEREGRALRAFEGDRRLEPPLGPRALAEGTRDGLHVLVQEAVAGASLSRRLAVRSEGDWPEQLFRAVGRRLGELHATGRLHGDAWGRNVLCRRAEDGESIVQLVDWESSRRGDSSLAEPDAEPLAELLHLLFATARADLLARGPRSAARAHDPASLARWVLVPGAGGPARAAAGLLSEWGRGRGLVLSPTASQVEGLLARPELCGLPGALPAGAAHEAAAAIAAIARCHDGGVSR